MDSVKPSNSQLADKVADYAAKLFFEERGYGISIQENVDIGNAVYGAFNHATVVQAQKRAA